MTLYYVTGMHSSGTSLTARYLSLCNVNMMGNLEVDKLCEHRPLRKVSHAILRDSKIHRYDTSFDFSHINPSDSTKQLMKKTAQTNLNYTNGNWGFKAPILSLTIWAWIPLLKTLVDDEIIVVNIFRHPAELIPSFQRRKSRKDNAFVSQNNTPEKHIERIWYNYYKSVLDYEQAFNQKTIYLKIDDLLQNPKKFTDLLGIDFKPITEVYNPKLFIQLNKVDFYNLESVKLWDKLTEKSMF